MKRILLGGAVAAACLGTAPAMAEGYDDAGSVYISPMANYTLLDNRRISKDDFGYQVGLGYNFPRNWAAEINLAPNAYSITGFGAHEKITAISADVLYRLLPPSYLFRPYVLGGLARSRTMWAAVCRTTMN
jgi:hypothetical protein